MDQLFSYNSCFTRHLIRTAYFSIPNFTQIGWAILVWISKKHTHKASLIHKLSHLLNTVICVIMSVIIISFNQCVLARCPVSLKYLFSNLIHVLFVF